jgi:hypothetical protein
MLCCVCCAVLCVWWWWCVCVCVVGVRVCDLPAKFSSVEVKCTEIARVHARSLTFRVCFVACVHACLLLCVYVCAYVCVCVEGVSTARDPLDASLEVFEKKIGVYSIDRCLPVGFESRPCSLSSSSSYHSSNFSSC